MVTVSEEDELKARWGNGDRVSGLGLDMDLGLFPEVRGFRKITLSCRTPRCIKLPSSYQYQALPKTSKTTL